MWCFSSSVQSVNWAPEHVKYCIEVRRLLFVLIESRALPYDISENEERSKIAAPPLVCFFESNVMLEECMFDFDDPVEDDFAAESAAWLTAAKDCVVGHLALASKLHKMTRDALCAPFTSVRVAPTVTTPPVAASPDSSDWGFYHSFDDEEDLKAAAGATRRRPQAAFEEIGRPLFR